MTVRKQFMQCNATPTYTATLNTFTLGGTCTFPNQEVLNLYSNYYNQNLNNKYNNIKWYFKYTSDPDGCNGNNGITTDWFLVGSGQTMTPPNGTGQIKAIFYDPCYPTLTQTYTDNYYYAPLQDKTMIAPNALLPNSSISENRIIRIQEYSPCAPFIGLAPAYGKIKDFKLVVFNRWGEEIRVFSKADVPFRGVNDAVMQGDIIWDGRDRFNTIVQDGVYALKLYFKYCDNIPPSWCFSTNWYSPTYGNGWCDVTEYITNSAVSPCMKWNFFSFNGNGCQSYFDGNAGKVKAITVIR